MASLEIAIHPKIINVDTPRFDERYLSQIPVLEQLINLGFEYLTPEEALAARQGKTANVLLEDILLKQLKDINRIPYKGNEYRFSEENLQLAVQRLKNVKYDGLRKTNEAVYERLTLGLALEQTVEGNTKSFTLRYIDWQNWKKNAFHVTAEFMVACRRSVKITRLNVVLFVNGIPLVVIECVPPSDSIDRAISQSMRNQHDTYTPKLFSYVQLLLAANRDTARFGTIGTPTRFWLVWKESDDSISGNALAESIRLVSDPETKDRLFSGDFACAREFFNARDIRGEHRITEQARVIYGLCRPKRLLELIYKFSVFDNGIKKIARYQQYFAVKRILAHIRTPDVHGKRRGGIVWHTQGSGKSLTMVMLARSLAEEPDISNPRIVLITDRKDLDKQIKDTFAACGMPPQRAKTGRDLLELVSGRKANVITTLVHKFDKALNIRKYRDDSIDIFMLIDESHRTQFGSFAARMRQMFPNACYLGFTGTPLMKKEKNNFAKFGGLIDRYDIDWAIRDKAIVPLLYEARHVEIYPDKPAIDSWFSRYAQGLTDTQKAALKKKYTHAKWLNKTEKLLYLHALDISRHFRNTLQGSGYKGQLVAPDKITALIYHRYLDEIGLISSEVIISSPGNREGQEEAHNESGINPKAGDARKDDVVGFWRKMIRRYGSEAEYNKQIINRFKHGDDPEILIVVDKLQTGFDAPRNAVLYITRALRGHTLLQAIARVNRIHEDEHGSQKKFGFIVDYAGILGDLDKALSQYSAFEDFDDEDLNGTLISIQEELRKLPRRHAELWELFENTRHDGAIREMLLRDQVVRNTFHERLAKFRKTLDIALSSDRFITNAPMAECERYKEDLKRFRELAKIVPFPPATGIESNYQSVDYCDEESRMKEMLNTYVTANEATQLNPPVLISPFDILNENPFGQLRQGPGYGSKQISVTQANTIAKATREVLAQHEEWDPTFYGKFSKLIQQVIDDFKAKRLSDMEYLERMRGIYAKVKTRTDRDVPLVLRNNRNATAFYRILRPYFPIRRSAAETDFHAILQDDDTTFYTEVIRDAAIAVDDILRRHWKVRFWDDSDAIKQTMNDIDDYLYDEIKGTHGIKLSLDQMDEIIEKIMRAARRTTPHHASKV
uniref:Type I restriction enzyme endonuclease subunit n=1 Tax=Candidatus Kentrum sp. TUN TaxID=2126343 RepID=A0A450ZEG4_9GAMM|nr:MAG: type I restriction enzyme, R subunit [Candidatus Kentron sp. TUN]